MHQAQYKSNNHKRIYNKETLKLMLLRTICSPLLLAALLQE
jgi:hypothetical protein